MFHLKKLNPLFYSTVRMEKRDNTSIQNSYAKTRMGIKKCITREKMIPTGMFMLKHHSGMGFTGLLFNRSRLQIQS
jgi:hypothetical protein